MAKRQSAKPASQKGRNPDRSNGKANKKNPKTQPLSKSDSDGLHGYSMAAIEKRAAKRNQSVAEHIAYLTEHRATRSERRRNARRIANAGLNKEITQAIHEIRKDFK